MPDFTDLLAEKVLWQARTLRAGKRSGTQACPCSVSVSINLNVLLSEIRNPHFEISLPHRCIEQTRREHFRRLGMRVLLKLYG
jgi:hypothetical protein